MGTFNFFKKSAKEKAEMKYSSRNPQKFLEHCFLFLEKTFIKSIWRCNGDIELYFRNGTTQITVSYYVGDDWKDDVDILIREKGIDINLLDCSETFGRASLQELKIQIANKKIGEKIAILSEFLKENFDYSKREYLETSLNNYMHLSIWGESIGGDIGGNTYRLVDQKLNENQDELILFFEGNEKCSIFNPIDIVKKGVGGKRLIIKHAEKIVWEFYYYGKPQSPETLNVIEYVFVDESHVHVTEKGSWPRDEIIKIKNEIALDSHVLFSGYGFEFETDCSVDELIDQIVDILKPEKGIFIESVDKINRKIVVNYKRFFSKQNVEMIFDECTNGIVMQFSDCVHRVVDPIYRGMAEYLEGRNT